MFKLRYTSSKIIAKIQRILYRMFGVHPKKPCGHTKSSYGYYCHQPFDSKHCIIINDGDRHEVVCKCCGETRMLSNEFIDPCKPDEWFLF